MGLPLEKHIEEAQDEKNKLKGKTDGVKLDERKFTDILFCLFFILFIYKIINNKIFW